MKPLEFSVHVRGNRTRYLKCDRATRIRFTSYLLRVGAALLEKIKTKRDACLAEDLDVVARMLATQRALVDWNDFDVDAFNRVWTSGRRNRLQIETVKGGRYEDLRRIGVAALELAAARALGLDPNLVEEILEHQLTTLEESQDAAASSPAVTQRTKPDASQTRSNGDLEAEVEIMRDTIDELTQEIARLRAASGQRPPFDAGHQRARDVLVGVFRGATPTDDVPIQ